MMKSYSWSRAGTWGLNFPSYNLWPLSCCLLLYWLLLLRRVCLRDLFDFLSSSRWLLLYFHWSTFSVDKQAQILHPLSTGHVPLTIMVAPGGPSLVSPNSSRSSDPPRRSEPSACWPCSSQCTPVCGLPLLQLELPLILIFSLVSTGSLRFFPVSVDLILVKN